MTNKEQMELALNSTTNGRFPAKRQRRMPGARWWFSQMRLAVLNTTEWNTTGNVRPEQIHLLGLR